MGDLMANTTRLHGTRTGLLVGLPTRKIFWEFREPFCRFGTPFIEGQARDEVNREKQKRTMLLQRRLNDGQKSVGCCCDLVSLVLGAAEFFAGSSPPPSGAVEEAVGKENYAEAKKQADAILQRSAPEDRAKTMTVYARILLGLGQKEQARQFLNTLSGGQQSSRRKGHSAGPATAGTLLPIYAAWLKALDGQADAAIKTLEKMLQQAGGAPNEVTAEAADVLAMLYMARGEQEKAKKAVDFGLKTLQYQGVNSGYVLALLRGRLNSDIAAGEAKRLYNEAENRRAEKKFVEAGQLFAQVRAMYPKNQWGHASGFRIGQCYVGLNRPRRWSTGGRSSSRSRPPARGAGSACGNGRSAAGIPA